MQLQRAQEIAKGNNQTIYNDGRGIRLEGNNPPNDFATFSKYQFKNLPEDDFIMIAKAIDKGLKCPECKSEEVWDVDCPTCEGYTEVQVSVKKWATCEDCYGEGVIQNQFECGDCHHIWEAI